MKIERDERRFDFHDIGLAIKRAREASGMTQEQLAYIVDRAPRTIMYNENDGQHPSFNTFYQMVTMFDISVDQYFYPSQNSGSECRMLVGELPKPAVLRDKLSQSPGALHRSLRPVTIVPGPYFHARLLCRADDQYSLLLPRPLAFAAGPPGILHKALFSVLPTHGGIFLVLQS
mgnify:CR=1 FL=1